MLSPLQQTGSKGSRAGRMGRETAPFPWLLVFEGRGVRSVLR